jgi:PAS domain-containing protein
MVELPDEARIEDTHIADYYPPDLRAFAQEAILAEMLAKDKWAGETSFRNWKTGARIPVLDTHFLIREPVTRRVIGMATITRDISTQKAQRDALEKTNQRLTATMRELAESQRFLRGVLDYSPNAIVIKNLDGRYVIVNKGFPRSRTSNSTSPPERVTRSCSQRRWRNAFARTMRTRSRRARRSSRKNRWNSIAISAPIS